MQNNSRTPARRRDIRRAQIAALAACMLLESACQMGSPSEASSVDRHRHGFPPATARDDRFAAAISRTRARLYADSELASTETANRSTENFLSALIESAWRVSHAARYLESPHFSTGRGVVGLPGLFNPDNLYKSALLNPDGSYRISGTRGTHARFTLQFLDAYPLVELTKGLLVIDLDELGVQAGDPFSIRLGSTPSTREGELSWPMPEGARAVLARMTFNDWAAETPTEIRIERLDGTRDVPQGPVHADLAADYLDRMTSLWADGYLADLQRLPENAFPPIRPSGNEAGGLAGQQGVITRYRLSEDEALVVTVRASDAAYQSIQLGDRWFTTQNPVRYPSSLNQTQARTDGDGLLRFVISHRDPGIENWLATAGAERGYIMIRWQGIRTPLGAQDQPEAKRVRLAEIDRHVSADATRLTSAERADALAYRSALPALKR